MDKNNNEVNIDLIGVAEQSIDAIINNQILEGVAKGKDGEFAVAVIKLFNEYGIYGRRILEFNAAIIALFRLYGREL